jgi:O-antigen ligase
MFIAFRRPSFQIFLSPAIPLALFLCGPFYYYASNYWFGIRHPAWFVWAYLLLTASAALYRGARVLARTINIVDILFLLFLLLVGFSLATHDFPESARAAYLLLVNAALPYGAARLLPMCGIALMVRTCAILCMLAIPISLAGLIALSKEEFEQDRIHTLFSFYYSNNEVGLMLGLSMVILSVFALRDAYKRPYYYFAAALAVLIFCTSLLTILTARGGLVASVIASLILIFISTASPVKNRLALLGTLIVSIVVSVQLIPDKRKIFLGQLDIMSTSIPDLVLRYTPDKDKVEPLKEGNSASIRLLYYRDVLNIILKNPVSGVGVGSFGNYSSIVQLQSNNALCGDPIKGYVKCTGTTNFASPHSNILHVITELGLAGAGVFVAFILLAIQRLQKLVRETPRQEVKVLGWYLGGMWLFFFTASQFYGNYFTDFQFYLLTGCLAAFIAGDSGQELKK